uniref:putative ABC transporter permease n=1 Tax=Ruminococcus bromii TaxID=40518 RepID=UPI00402A5628
SMSGRAARSHLSHQLAQKFSNNGFLTSPFCPMYGFSAVICYTALKPFENSKLILFIGSTLILSALMVVVGVLVEKTLKFKPWNFSSSKFSIGNYITFPYALFLGLLGMLLVGLIIPVLRTAVEAIPFWVSLILVLCFCGIIAIDYVFSMITTIRLLRRIAKLKNSSELMDKGATEVEIQELEENYNRLFTENILRKRLAHAYPDLTHMAYVKQINAKIEEIKQDNMKEYTQTFESKEDKPFAYGFCFTKLFYLFVIGSFIGTILETIWAFCVDGHFEMRVGMVYGPFIPVYGGGACFLTAALYKLYKLNDTLVFVISAFVGAGFEYFCSWLQEQMFGTVSWDYSDTPFNLDGRTNLMYALIWGFLGLVWVRYLYPWTAKLIEKIPKRAGAIITTFLIVFMAFNGFMSVTATARWTQRTDGVPASNSFEEYLDEKFDNEKMEFLFPGMKKAAEAGVTTEGVISNERPYLDATDPDNGMKIEQGKDVSEIN